MVRSSAKRSVGMPSNRLLRSKASRETIHCATAKRAAQLLRALSYNPG